MINICDLDLVGREINQGEYTINISKGYFQDEEIGEKEAVELLKSYSVLNLVGKNIVTLALRHNLAKKNSVKTIEDIPFLMIFSFMGNY